MAALVRWTVQDPQNIIDTFGSTPVTRIERATYATQTDWAEITTATVVAGTTEYEHRDQTGEASTHAYRLRYSKLTPSTAVDYSGYGPVFQAGAPGGEVITLETAKTWTTITDTTDDGWLALAVDAVNRAICGPLGIGVDIGPSPDTTRTYDASGATANGKRLWIRGGIRAFTAVEVSTDGSTWTAVTSDVRVGPLAQDRAAGEPGAYIEFRPYITGSVSSFRGYVYVRITCTAFAGFGWDAYPADLVQAAVAALRRMSMEHDQRVSSAWPTETDALRYLNKDLLRGYRQMYFPAAA